MKKGKEKNYSGVGHQFDPSLSNGKKEDMKPQPEDKQELKKKAFKEGQGNNDSTEPTGNKK